MAFYDLGNLAPHREHWIQAGGGLLKNDADLAAAKVAHAGLSQLHHVGSVNLYAPACNAAAVR